MKKWIYLLLILFFLTKFNLVFQYHDTRWDESVFIGMGKYLFSGGEKGLWEPIIPIGLPIIFGVLWKLGLNPIISSELISIFFAMGCIYLVFMIGKTLYNEQVGFISALILTITPVFYYFSSYGFTGIPSTFFALFGLYFFIKKKYFLTGVLSSISFLFRFPQGLLFVIFGLLLFLKTKKKLFDFVIGIFIVVLPFLIFNLFMYKDMFLPFFEAIPHQANLVHSIIKETWINYLYNFLYYLIEILKQNLLLLFGILYFKSKKKILLPFLLFGVYFTYITNKQPRFLLVFLPYLSIMAGFGLYNLLIKKNKFIVYIIVFAFIVPSLFTINTQYNWRNSYVPEINLLYTFFNDKEGIVLTMVPTPTAYSNLKFIPFYNNVDDAVKIYKEKSEDSNYILYSDEFYPCYNENCYVLRNNLFESISKNKLIFNLSYGQNYYIFER